MFRCTYSPTRCRSLVMPSQDPMEKDGSNLEANDGPGHASEEYNNHSAHDNDGGDLDGLDDVSLDDPDYMPREHQGSDQASSDDNNDHDDGNAHDDPTVAGNQGSMAGCGNKPKLMDNDGDEGDDEEDDERDAEEEEEEEEDAGHAR
eukprot:5047073-Pleurochrysis_carterae.AAC.1